MPATHAASHDPLARALALAANQDDVLLVSDVLRLGLTKWDLRTLRRTSELSLRGALTVPPLRDPMRAAARATQLLLPRAVISHLSAVRLHGLAGLDYWSPEELVHATLPRSATRWQRAGVRLHFQTVAPKELVDLDGLRALPIGRSLRDCAPMLDRVRFVSLVDNALHQGWITLEELAELELSGRASGWLRLCALGSESPSESVVRLILCDAGLAPDHLQHDVFTDGGFHVARLDMAWTENGKKVGLEVESGEHDRLKALYRDRDRLNQLRSQGWDVRQVTAHDAHRRPGYVRHQVLQALSLQPNRD
jgi:hypothetical protein